MPTATAWRRTRRRRSPGSRLRPTAATARRSSRSRCSRFAGRGGPQDKAEAAALLDKAAKLGHVAAAYNLALLYLEGQAGAAEHRARRRADAQRRRRRQPRGAIRARDALQGRQRRREGSRPRPRSCSAPRRAAATTRREVEYAIALFNGTGIDEGRERRRRAVPQGRAQGQCGGAEPARAHPGDRPRPAGRSDRGRRNGTPSPRPAAPPTSGWKTTCSGIKDNERAAGENAARLWLAHAKPNS